MKPDILVPIHTFPDGNAASLAVHTAQIARHLDATVHALVLEANFPGVSSALGNMLIDVPELIGGAKARCRERGAAVVAAMEKEMGALHVPLRVSHVECFPGTVGDIVSGVARYHDVVLVGIGAGDVTRQTTAEAAIFGSGRPTLLVPEAAPTITLGHVMIGWDGSRVAARAVFDARDLLQQAQTVTIASVTDEKALADDDAGRRLAEYFGRGGIVATVARVEGRGRPIAQTLQAHALEIGAGLLVMGGFAHSRMRDFVLGGATSGILRNLELPVFLSH